MAVPAMTSALGWLLQTAKETYPAASDPFYWHRFREGNLSLVQLDSVLDPEVGGSLLPDGAYKAGYWTAGDVDLVPRLDHAIGYLFYSFAGNVTSTSLPGQSGTAAKNHVFPGRADQYAPDKWLTFRRRVNGASGDLLGEEYRDCRVLSILLSGGPGTPASMRFGIMGLGCNYVADPSGVGWTPTTDKPAGLPVAGLGGFDTIPLTTKGYVDLQDGARTTNVQSIQIALNVGGMDPRQEMVIGSYSPSDITTLARSVVLSATMFYRNKTLYNNIYRNGGSSWSPVVWTSNNPVVVEFETPDTEFGTPAVVGKLGFWAQKVMWRMDPIGLRGGDVISMRLTGTVLDNGANDSWRLYLINAHQDYTAN